MEKNKAGKSNTESGWKGYNYKQCGQVAQRRKQSFTMEKIPEPDNGGRMFQAKKVAHEIEPLWHI